MRNSQEVMLVNGFDPEVRTLWITKLFRKPLAALSSMVTKLLAGTASSNDLRYFLHSSHDT